MIGLDALRTNGLNAAKNWNQTFPKWLFCWAKMAKTIVGVWQTTIPATVNATVLTAWISNLRLALAWSGQRFSTPLCKAIRYTKCLTNLVDNMAFKAWFTRATEAQMQMQTQATFSRRTQTQGTSDTKAQLNPFSKLADTSRFTCLRLHLHLR